MSKETRNFITALKEATDKTIDSVPYLRQICRDVDAEFARLGTQGSMELASALFDGHAFVPYGPGQYTPDKTPEVSKATEAMAREREQSKGMEI